MPDEFSDVGFATFSRLLNLPACEPLKVPSERLASASPIHSGTSVAPNYGCRMQREHSMKYKKGDHVKIEVTDEKSGGQRMDVAAR